MKKFAVIFVLLVLALLMAVYATNYFSLQNKLDSIIKSDPRSKGLLVSVRYKYFVNYSVLVYDLKSISDTNSMADTFRVFLQFASKVQTKNFDEVELAYRGTTKFKIEGEYFRQLGKEYDWQNPIYTIRSFPENVKTPDGTRAFPAWTGGFLGVTKAQMEDFNDFHKKWYLEDMLKN